MDGKALHLFTSGELEGLVEGEKELDFDELKRNAEYEGGFDKNHGYVVTFWSIITDFDFEQKKKFLHFCTGANRAPVGGLKQLEPKFKVNEMAQTRNHCRLARHALIPCCFQSIKANQNYEVNCSLLSKTRVALGSSDTSDECNCDERPY